MAPPRVTFFPPLVPILGGSLYEARQPIRGTNLRPAPPEGLADYVNECFYPVLGTRLFQAGVDRKLQDRLDAYRANRTALINELVEKLAILEPAEPAVRATELGTLSASQRPRILALEAEAERLRDELVRGNLHQGSADWSAERTWKLGETKISRPDLAAAAEFHVIRAAAYYQKGLTAEQRGLLREVAMELQVAARAARRLPSSRNDPIVANFDLAAVFFSPETARLILPTGLPSALVSQIATFNRDKAVLKQELHDAVVQQDKASNGRRTDAFVSLAESQRARLAALGDLAEEIRLGFAALPPPPPPAASPLPPDLLARIEAYEKDRAELDGELNDRLRVVILPQPMDAAPTRLTKDEDRYWHERVNAARAATVKRVTENFQRENRDRYTRLAQRFELISADLAAAAEMRIDPKTGRPLTPQTLQLRHNEAMRQFDRLGREEAIFKNYRTAMLLPGLSPEQRRLLLGAAVVGLAQALPPGEQMPTSAIPPL